MRDAAVGTTVPAGAEAQTERIVAALERLRSALASRPELGRASVNVSVSELRDGIRCVSHEKSFRVESGLGTALGGDGAAPSPAALVRAAFGACLAMGYQLRAAEAGVDLRAVRVTVESESDVRGMLGSGGGEPPGFSGLRYHVEIDSPAPADELTRIVELGDRYSPVLDMLTTALTVERSVSFGPVAARQET
jgi:uncharacterized OsmC-like protein